jgi:hypothetical protein
MIGSSMKKKCTLALPVWRAGQVPSEALGDAVAKFTCSSRVKLNADCARAFLNKQLL